MTGVQTCALPILAKENVSKEEAKEMMRNPDSPYYLNTAKQKLSYTGTIWRMGQVGLIPESDAWQWILTIMDKFNPNNYGKVFTNLPNIDVNPDKNAIKGTSNTLDVKINGQKLKMDLGESRTYDLTVRDLYDVEVE